MKTWITLMLVVAISMCAVRVAPALRGFIYAALREREARTTRTETASWNSLLSKDIEVRFKSDPDVASIVLSTAQDAWQQIALDFNYKHNERILILISDSKDELREAYGWSEDDDAAGVYWAGAIRLLSPRAWVGSESLSVIKEQFESEGPLSHEMTHLVIDYLTNGNYPRWFSEGVAQYEEFTISGFELMPSHKVNQYYTYDELNDGFESLPDQAVAYRQAFLLVNFMVGRYGWSSIGGTLQSLAHGTGFGDAIKGVYGSDMDVIEKTWSGWVSSSPTSHEISWRNV